MVPVKHVVEIENLLNAEADFRDSLHMPSPYGETTLINASFYSKSKSDRTRQTVTDFRKSFLKEMKRKARRSPIAKELHHWLKKEDARDKAVRLPQKVSADEILEELDVETEVSNQFHPSKLQRMNIIMLFWILILQPRVTLWLFQKKKWIISSI